MLFNFGNILNESQNNIEEILPTNEGFSFEGGFETAIMLAEQEHHAIKMTGLNCDLYSSVKLMEASKNNTLTESAIEEAYLLQEKVLGSLFESLRNMLRKLAARVKEIIRSLGAHFDKIFNKKGYIANAKVRLKGVTEFDDAKLEGYSYTQDAIDPVMMYNKMSAKVTDKYNSLIRAIKTGDKPESVKTENEETLKSLEEYKSTDFLDTLCVEVGADDHADYSKFLFKKLRNGKDSKEEISISSTSEAFKMIDGFATTSTTLKGLETKVDTMYNASKKVIDKAETDHKEATKKSENGAKTVAEIKLKVITAWANVTTKTAILANDAVKAKLAALKEEQSQNYALINKADSGSKAAIKKAKLDESVDIFNMFRPSILK